MTGEAAMTGPNQLKWWGGQGGGGNHKYKLNKDV